MPRGVYKRKSKPPKTTDIPLDAIPERTSRRSAKSQATTRGSFSFPDTTPAVLIVAGLTFSGTWAELRAFFTKG